jgi:hypothetical protein
MARSARFPSSWNFARKGWRSAAPRRAREERPARRRARWGRDLPAYLMNAGQDVYCQFWGRDTVATGSFVSDGIHYTLEP